MNISTRRKLINEIKDYDKHMNGRVVNMQKRKNVQTRITRSNTSLSKKIHVFENKII